MNFTNGILEWRATDDLTPHRASNLETTQFPYPWDPDRDCPRFDHWLATMLEPDQITLAWKILGYMMLSGNPLQVAFMLYGEGSNGKSTFAHVIEHLVGMPNTSAVSLNELSQRFSTSSMIGKVANVVGDIDFDYQVSTAMFKQITGSDAMQFERKNKDAFRAVLWATCLFSANRIPETNDGSDGYAERWVPLHFKRKATDHKIRGFSEEGLWEEIPGIAYKAVQALRTIPISQGSDRSAAFDLTSDSSRAAVEEFREASNSYYAWVKKYTVPSETEVMKPKELWSAYKLATGRGKNQGTNCPAYFSKILERQYGQPKMRRGMYLGVQRNVRGYAVAVVDDDDTSATDSDFFPEVTEHRV
jgi:P4 family phage/plasmid primase-like protien